MQSLVVLASLVSELAGWVKISGRLYPEISYCSVVWIAKNELKSDYIFKFFQIERNLNS